MSVDSHDAPPPHAIVLQMLTGMWVSQVLSAVAQLGVADLIAAGTRSVDHLAEECSADANALHRLLRAAATVGLLIETAPGEFALTPLGTTLRASTPGSLRDFIIAETAPGHRLPWGRLADAVKRGGAMTKETLGLDPWDYYATNDEEGRCFARGMSDLSAIVSGEVARVYDPGDVHRVVDIGGSEGVLLRGILGRAPNARGVIFDRADVIEGARRAVAESGMAERVELVSGDFFAEVPGEGDVYLLKSILHDWADDKCEEIVRTIHRCAPKDSRIVLVEMLLPDTPQPSPITLMDMNMLVMLGGRERTAGEYSALLQRCGYNVERVIPTGGLFGVIEARRV
ncbi:MAG: methyltransferase [Thermoanaerobaculia bacterium]